ncbi:MAG TPA: thiolase family protein [Novosphingobium sp.]
MVYGEKQTAVTGIGMSEISRGASKSALALTIDACMEAIADAGLKRSDIDGVASYPGSDNNASGLSPVGVPGLMDALRLEVNWYSGGGEVPGQLGAVFNAIGAIAAGYCRHVLVFRTVYEGSARKLSKQANALMKPGERIHSQFKSFAPYGAAAAAVQQALYFQRFVHDYGLKPETTGRIAVNNRRNASLNPAAVYRTPMTLEDYFASEMLATPVRLFDCDVPCDGSAAMVISRIDAARDCRNPVLRVESVGCAQKVRNSWDQLAGEALGRQATISAGAMMWERTDFRPKDVDAAQFYDGFTFHTAAWLSAAGFCKPGEENDFVGDGSRIALEGELPINTGGGQLSMGRMHAYGQLHESATQLWRRGGARQIAKDVKVSINTTAGGPLSGCMMLVRDA